MTFWRSANPVFFSVVAAGFGVQVTSAPCVLKWWIQGVGGNLSKSSGVEHQSSVAESQSYPGGLQLQYFDQPLIWRKEMQGKEGIRN